MSKEEYEKVIDAFNTYFTNYNDYSIFINLKYDHSFRVAELMEELSKKLNLDEEHTYLSKTIGLLHDIGRFEQIKQTNSFSDNQLDHADYAVDYLFGKNHIRDFIEDSKYDSIIEKAIKNHNKLQIENDLTEEELFYSKMIRDMDKIDIYHQVATHLNHKFDSLPSEEVIGYFYNGESVPKEKVNNKSDQVIVYFSFLNDFNFKESFDILKETNNLTEYIESVEVSKWYVMFDVLKNDAYKLLESNYKRENIKLLKKEG